MVFKPKYYGRIHVPLIFTFDVVGGNGSQSFRIVRELRYICVRDVALYMEIQPVAPFKREKPLEATYAPVIQSDFRPDFKYVVYVRIIRVYVPHRYSLTYQPYPERCYVTLYMI